MALFSIYTSNHISHSALRTDPSHHVVNHMHCRVVQTLCCPKVTASFDKFIQNLISRLALNPGADSGICIRGGRGPSTSLPSPSFPSLPYPSLTFPTLPHPSFPFSALSYPPVPLRSRA